MPIEVLLIEDNRPDAVIVRNALQQEGLDVRIHEIVDAEAAAAYLRRMGTAPDVPRPEIILMDLNLPRGDGIELLREIRKAPERADIPVIVMTSSDAPKDRAAVTQFRHTQYFRKPLELDAFLQIGVVVRDVLEERRRTAS